MTSAQYSSDFIANAVKALKLFPLCNRCLGRLFARYGINLSNELRGKSIKTYVAMALTEMLSKGRNSIDLIKELAPNAGYPISELYRKYVSGNLCIKKCYVCDSKLGILIAELAFQAVEKLKEIKASTFLVGVKKDSRIEQREKEVASILSIDSWESVRREVKREVGKKIQALLGLKPDFKNPDVVVMLDLDKAEVSVNLMPLYLKGTYLKLGRFISQMTWIGRDGTKKYKLSLEEECRRLLELVGGTDVKVHASGREDVDARMLGDGRPLIIEVRNPRRKDINIGELTVVLEKNPWIRIILEGRVKPSAVTALKQSNPHKVYRVIALSDEGVSEKELCNLKEFFSNRVVKQLTPKRVLRRKGEVLRVKRVYEVNAKLLHPNIVEFIVWCEGGLYVKELVHGDDGRTTPSFAEFLRKNLTVLFLDVIKVGRINLP